MINYQFKILIAFAILFVVCGHTGSYILCFDGIFMYDSFHMPLFAFISGYFFHYKTNEKSRINQLKKELLKQSKRLLIPFFLWNIIYSLILTFLRNNEPFLFLMGGDISFDGIFYRSLIMGDFSVLNIPSWFILTLFFVKIISYMFRFILDLFNIKISIHKIMFLFLIIGICGIKIAQNDMIFDFKILLSRILYLSFWYEVGYYYKSFLEKYDTFSNVKYIIVCLIVQYILLFMHSGGSMSIVYAGIYPYGVFTTILYAANGIAFWLRISKILEPYLKENKYILYIGNHTFDIMMHHAFFIKLYNGLFWFISLNFHIFNNFDIEKYRTEIWYIFLPYNSNAFSFIDVLVGVIFPLICVYFYEKKFFLSNK